MTRFREVFRNFTGLALFGISVAMAGDAGLDSREQALANARRDYYQALKSGKGATPQARKQLYRTLVAPAEASVAGYLYQKDQLILKNTKSMAEAAAEDRKDREDGYVEVTDDQGPDLTAQVHGEGVEAPSSNSKTTTASAAPTDSSTPMDRQPASRGMSGDDGIAKKSEVLDGKSIPKEISFGSKKSEK